MLCRDQYLSAVRTDQFLIIRMRLIDLKQTDNSIERCADIMADTRKETAFCRVCAIRTVYRLLKFPVLILQILCIRLLDQDPLLLIALLRFPAYHIDDHDHQQIHDQPIHHIFRRR